MNYYSLLIAAGVCVVLVPNLGFPGQWKIILLSILGCVIVLLAYLAKRELPQSDDDRHESVLPE